MLWSCWLRAQVLIHIALPHRGRHGRLGIPFVHLKSPLLLQSNMTHSVVNRVIKHIHHQERKQLVTIAARHGNLEALLAEHAEPGC